MNKIVRTEVVPPFKAKAKPGDRVEVTAAIELNKEHINLKDLELIPLRFKNIQ